MILLYMDHNVRLEIATGLRGRGVDVVTAKEDGRNRTSDSELLTRATALGGVLFTHDEDLLAEAARRQASGAEFAGVVYGHQLRVTIGDAIRDLEFISKAGEPQDFANRIEHIPLR